MSFFICCTVCSHNRQTHSTISSQLDPLLCFASCEKRRRERESTERDSRENGEDVSKRAGLDVRNDRTIPSFYLSPYLPCGTLLHGTQMACDALPHDPVAGALARQGFGVCGRLLYGQGCSFRGHATPSSSLLRFVPLAPLFMHARSHHIFIITAFTSVVLSIALLDQGTYIPSSPLSSHHACVPSLFFLLHKPSNSVRGMLCVRKTNATPHDSIY